ncbi:hypothetical protein SORBI_3003G181400 [Sorghum bicolor]|uniref:Uncharacterized protein n=1 Tax=Sorghum bicolor TaxID=4558 RepID=A0A1W0VXU4_SORBI|nr:hypothetical protein SORBI_3003G181400 [Sorghum bicolor]
MLLQPHGHGGWRPHSRGRMQHALSHPAPRRTTGTSPARRSTGLGAWPVRISATSSTSSATQPRLPRPRPYRLADLRTSPTNPVVQTMWQCFRSYVEQSSLHWRHLGGFCLKDGKTAAHSYHFLV